METPKFLGSKNIDAGAYRHWGKEGISAFGLKLIACLSMLVDHIKYILYNPFLQSMGISNELFSVPSFSDTYNFIGFLMGAIGRLAMPIFAFQIAEGYVHSKSKWKYFTRLVVFAVISEIPFDFGFYGKIFYWGKQNVFFTLALGLLSIIIFDAIIGLSLRWKWLKIAIGLFAMLVCGFLADAIGSDYGFMGVVMIFIFYAFHNRIIWRDVIFGGMVILPLVQAGEFFAALDVPLFHLYNGKKGYNSKAAQIGCYLFYPLHILLLGCIKCLLWG